MAQVNGVSSETYFEVFCRLGLYLKRRIYVVLSQHGVDELLPGMNQVTLVSSEGRQDRTFQYDIDQASTCRALVQERFSVDEHVRILVDIATYGSEHPLFNTIVSNAALFIMASRGTLDLEDLVEFLHKEGLKIFASTSDL
jgi:anthranilate phosphoribosyltransferase